MQTKDNKYNKEEKNQQNVHKRTYRLQKLSVHTVNRPYPLPVTYRDYVNRRKKVSVTEGGGGSTPPLPP